jgi:hypothetical protein
MIVSHLAAYSKKIMGIPFKVHRSGFKVELNILMKKLGNPEP